MALASEEEKGQGAWETKRRFCRTPLPQIFCRKLKRAIGVGRGTPPVAETGFGHHEEDCGNSPSGLEKRKSRSSGPFDVLLHSMQDNKRYFGSSMHILS